MAAFSNVGEAPYDDFTNRSPRAFRQQPMGRQPGRQDGFSTMHGGFGMDHNISSNRFGGRGDPFSNNFQPPQSNSMAFGPYDNNIAQTWNSPAPPMPSMGNGLGAMSQNGDFGPARSVKPSRGRAGISQVSHAC